MEKRNVMKTGVLWNEVMTALHAREFKDVLLFGMDMSTEPYEV